MNTPLSTPVRHAKLGIASTRSLPLTNEYKKLLNEQHQRLTIKHQQDLDLIDDIRSYVKSRLAIEREYSTALGKLGKQHASFISKRFALLDQCDEAKKRPCQAKDTDQHDSDSDTRLQNRLANNNENDPFNKPNSLYTVWSTHISQIQDVAKNREEQFEQLIMVVDKLKDIRTHKANIGKKCLNTHLRRIHEEILVSMVEIEKARKLYHEDESQAKKARENEEKIKKKRSGLLTKFTDLQAKKEKSMAQREANDIQSTQARNDYIMALAAGNAHLQHYYLKDLNDFISLIDDGVLDHCKIFMATLSECDINSLKCSLSMSQNWSRMVNLTGSQRTNSIFLDCNESSCLRNQTGLNFEACNNDPIQAISLDHNADYALQHEIDKWFTWFKKECRNLSQLIHQLEQCQRAFSDGRKSIELNGQTFEDIEGKIIDLKQQIRKSEAAKLKAQARLKVIKEGGMQIEEWSVVESEIRQDMLRAQEQAELAVSKQLARDDSSDMDRHASSRGGETDVHQSGTPGPGGSASYMFSEGNSEQVQLKVSSHRHDSDADSDGDGDGEGSINQLASVSRSTSNVGRRQQNAISGYSAFTDPSLVWQDDYSSAWASTPAGNTATPAIANPTAGMQSTGANVIVTNAYSNQQASGFDSAPIGEPMAEKTRFELLTATNNANNELASGSNNPATSAKSTGVATSMTVQSSSPLSAIVDGNQSSRTPYQGMMGDAYKSDFECDYDRSGQHGRSAASSTEPHNLHQSHQQQQLDPFGPTIEELASSGQLAGNQTDLSSDQIHRNRGDSLAELDAMLNKRVIALYSFDRTNEDDISFSENDILFVIEVCDSNWLRARNEATNEEGFIPASYVRLLEVTELQEDTYTKLADHAETVNWSTKRESTIDQVDTDKSPHLPPPPLEVSTFCRALYDYEPEEDTFEEDGLPHLALSQGDVMRIIDQGEDDGWWLVEKSDKSTRGHVPSMLVEEFDPNVESVDYDDADQDDENLDNERLASYPDDPDAASLPEFAALPPVLPPPPPEPSSEFCHNNEGPRKDNLQSSTSYGTEELQQLCSNQSARDNNNNDCGDGHQTDGFCIELPDDNSFVEPPSDSGVIKDASSLVATSFIITEPTPRIESRRFEDSIEAMAGDSAGIERQAHDNDVDTTSPSVEDQPEATQMSYSVIKEGFVLDRPTRQPTTAASTIVSSVVNSTNEQPIGEALDNSQTSENSARADNMISPETTLDEIQDVDADSASIVPMPPEVVIDGVEDPPPMSPDISEGRDETETTIECGEVTVNTSDIREESDEAPQASTQSDTTEQTETHSDGHTQDVCQEDLTHTKVPSHIDDDFDMT